MANNNAMQAVPPNVKVKNNTETRVFRPPRNDPFLYTVPFVYSGAHSLKCFRNY